MKNLLLIIFTMASMSIFAQKAEIGSDNNSWIPPMSTYSYRYDTKDNDSLHINLLVSTKRSQKHLLLRNMAALLTFGVVSASKSHVTGIDKKNRNVPINISLLAGVAGINVLSKKMRYKPVVVAKQFDIYGNLMKTDRWKMNKVRGSKVYSFSQTTATKNGYVVVSMDNTNRKAILLRSTVDISNAVNYNKQTRTTNNDGSNLRTSSEQPPAAWENNLEGVTIVGNTESGSFAFQGSFSSSFGSSNSWSVVGLGGGRGGYGGEGGNSGGDPSPEPGPEEKAITRKLNEINANKCEARYILDHAISDPGMAGRLYSNRTTVEKYMNDHGMGIANSVGSAKENAFKHALYSAYIYCSVGSQNALEMSNLHETCDGINQNQTIAERDMDNFNNAKGFEIAATLGCQNNLNFDQAVTEAYHNGSLHDINGNEIY